MTQERTEEERELTRKEIRQRAHDEGRKDYEIGLPATRNPFMNLELRAAWSDGWNDACADDAYEQAQERGEQ